MTMTTLAEATPQTAASAFRIERDGDLAISCDWRVMTDNPKARIGLPEVNLGIFPAWGGTTKLSRLIGLPAALDIILNGKQLEGRRAKQVGLVDEVVPGAIVLDVA